MKTLYIMRHAKSAWGVPDRDDLERPLLEKGKKRTKHIIDYLIEKAASIDLILTSHAVRAHETARIMAHGMKVNETDIRVDKQIYSLNEDRFFDLFFDLPSSTNNLMVIGHNPTLMNFANKFLDEKLDAFPTSGVICLQFKTDDWSMLATSKVKTVFVISPKMLK